MAIWSVGNPVSLEQQHRIRRRMMFDHFKWDPQSGDHGVLSDRPIVLSVEAWRELKMKAESLACELFDAEQELMARPELFSDLGLPRAIEQVLAKTAPVSRSSSPRFMRFDFHLTPDGWVISEVNADVPGGFIEASAFTELMCANYPGCVSAGDPSRLLMERVAGRIPKGGAVAFVHATSYADDRQVMEFLGKAISALGCTAYFTAPEHVIWKAGRARLGGPWSGIPLDAVLRFFPAEWLVNLAHQRMWEGFFASGETLQVNPPYALLVQSKKFPLVWDRLKTPLSAWRKLLPQTCDVRDVPLGDEGWVIKPVFSRVGEGIYIQGATDEKDAGKILKAARRDHRFWAAQKRFTPVPLSVEGVDHYPGIGVYVIDRQACGIYGRIARKPIIDHRAQDIAVLIQREGSCDE